MTGEKWRGGWFAVGSGHDGREVYSEQVVGSKWTGHDRREVDR